MGVVAVFTYPDPSHVGAVLGLVSRLVGRGETVTMYSGGPYRNPATETGAGFREYGVEMGISGTGPLGGMARRLKFAERVLPSVLDALGANPPDYLISDSAAIWGSIAGVALGIPRVSYRATFALHRAMISPESLVRMFYGSASRDFVLEGMIDLARYFEISQRIDRRYGTRTGDLIASMEDRQDVNLVFLSRQLQPHAECFDGTYHFVGSCASCPAVPLFDWSKLGPAPLIYVSLGTVFNNRPEFFRACMTAFSGGPWQVVMPVGSRVDRSALGPVPDNVLVFDYVPQAELLKRAALVICHGGANTVEDSIRAGAPMLIYPQAGDQFPLSDLVERLGAGLRLRAEDISRDRLRSMAERVISEPAFRCRAREIGEAMRSEGGAEEACDIVLRFAASPAKTRDNTLA